VLLDSRLRALLKAVVLGARATAQASQAGGEGIGGLFGASGALEPPYDPEALCLLFEHSNSLRQNVDAYATKIDGLGHRCKDRNEVGRNEPGARGSRRL
jgi:capsid portal protein